MSKICIFSEIKICDNCGECEVCELNSNKKCNNCGKCLELEGYDVKAIKIDEVFEAEEVVEELEDDFYDKDEIGSEEEQDNNENVIEIIEQLKPEELIKFEDYNSQLADKEYSKLNKEDFIPENDEIWEYIDDVEGVKELLENEADNSELLHEEFPGLITLKKY